MPTVVAVPHLFQHIGSQSSLGSRPLHQSSLYAGGLDAAFASQRTVVLVHASGAKRLSRTQRCLVAALPRIRSKLGRQVERGLRASDSAAVWRCVRRWWVR